MKIDFTKLYKKKDVVYLVRCIDSVGIQEIKKLKLRTVEPDYMVGSAEKGSAMYIDSEWANNIFLSNKEAKEYLSKISKKTFIEKYDIPKQLEEYDEDETDDVHSYIDGYIDEEEEDNE